MSEEYSKLESIGMSITLAVAVTIPPIAILTAGHWLPLLIRT